MSMARNECRRQSPKVWRVTALAAILAMLAIAAICPAYAWAANASSDDVDAQGGSGVSSITLSPSTGITSPPVAPAASEQSVSIRWRDTGDDMMTIGDDGSLSIVIDDARNAYLNPLVVGATVEWTSSGSADYEAGEISIRIPDHLFMARDGAPYETVYEYLYGTVAVPHLKAGLEIEVGVPEAPQQSADGWQYQHDEEAHELVIVNADQIGAGTKLVCEVDYVYDAQWSSAYGCEDDGLRHPVYTELTSEPVILYAEAEGAERSEIGPATIVTSNTLSSVGVEAEGAYDSWVEAWGEAPVDDPDSFYVVWRVTATFDHLYHPFSLALDIQDATQGEVIGISDAWIGGAPGNVRGEFDPDSCAFEAPSEANLSLGHLDLYAASENQDIGVMGQTASFAALVRYDRNSLKFVEGAAELTLAAEARLESLDQEVQTAQGTGTFTYRQLGFDAPPGNQFKLEKRRGAPDLTEQVTYYYQQGQVERLEAGQSTATGVDTSAAYASCFGETLGEGLDPTEVSSYGKKPYRVALVDDFAFIGDKRLGADEFEMEAVLDINSAAVTLHRGVPDYESGTYAIEPIEGAIEPLEVTLSVKRGDDGAWTPAARWTQTESGRLDCTGIEPLAEGVEVRAFDPSTAMEYWTASDRLSKYDGEQRYDLVLPAGTTGVKIEFETTAWAASIGDLERSDPGFGLTIASRVLPSERLKELARQSNSILCYKGNTLAAYDDEGVLLGFEGAPDRWSQGSPAADSLLESDRADYGASMYHATSDAAFVRADRAGSMLAYATKASNDTVGKKIDIGCIRAEVLFNTRTQEDDASGLPASVQPPETSGTFYLLLPAGFAADTSTLRAAERLSGGQPYVDPFDLPIEGGAVRDKRSKTTSAGKSTSEYSPLAEITSVESFPNWRDSGRELLKVEVRAAAGSAGYSAPFGNDQYVSGFILSFGGSYSWDAMADYGTSPKFRYAYMSGNDDMAAWDGRLNASPSDVEGGSSYVGGDWTDEDRMLLANLCGDASSQPRWLYSKAQTTLSYPTSAEYGLQLSAKASEDSTWTSAGDATKEVEVYAGATYSYRIRTALEEGSAATGNIIFDAIESYAPEGGQRRWRGTLEYIDTSAVASRGIDPIIYYSTTMDIDLSDENCRDLDDATLWTTEKPASMAEVTAVAIDCSHTKSGEAFELQGGESLVVVLGMRAPHEVHDRQPDVTYNQAWLASTVHSATGASSSKALHHEPTAVRIKTMSFKFMKADAEGVNDALSSNATKLDESSQLHGAEFELYRFDGEGEPGDALIGTNPKDGWTPVGADASDPNVEFTGLAPGTYRLVEKRAPSGYRLPAGEWSITLDPLLPQKASICAVSGAQGQQPPAFASTDKDGWILPNVASPSLPITGAPGIAGMTFLGVAAVAAGAGIRFLGRQKHHPGA